MANVIVSGFAAFGPYATNSSEYVVKALAGDLEIAPLLCATVVLPVEYGRCYTELRPFLLAHPDAPLICFGQAESVAIRLEQLARNRNGAMTADMAGVSACSLDPIVADGDEVLQSTLPLPALANALAADGFRCSASSDAGGYVCNNLFFHVMRDAPGRVRGFIHLPPLEGDNAWPAPDLVRAAAVIVRTVATQS